MKNKLIEEYIQLLKEASGLRLATLPEIYLPAPKDKLRQEIELEIEKDPEQESLYHLLGTLDLFSGEGVATRLASILVVVPFIISFFYVIWIVFSRASFLWLPIPFLFLGAALFSLTLKMLGRERTFGQILLSEVAGVITFASYTAIFIRLVIYSGFYGLYASTLSTGQKSFFDTA